MKILIISSEFPPCPGGIGNHAYGLFLNLKQLGYDVQVLSNSRNKDLEKKWIIENHFADSVKLIPRINPTIFTYFQRWKEGFKYINRIERENKFGVLFFSGKFSLWLLALLPVSINSKVIAIIHGSEIKQNLIGTWLFEKAFKRANFLVSVSSYTQNKLLLRFPEFKPKSIIINNGFLKFSNFNLFLYPQELNLGLCKLITVGNISRRKGQINVIKAIPDLIKIIPLIQYELLGIPTELELVKSEINRLSLNNYVFILGAVSEEIKWEKLQKASIFMMLSEELRNGDFEGFGIAILEANYLGIPAIGSKNSGIADAIHHGYSGFLVDPHNTAEIVEAVNAIMLNYETFRNQARQHASKFLWENKVKEYIFLLN